MTRNANQSIAPSVLEQEDVKEALEFLKEHASELNESSMSFEVPANYKNGKVQEFIRDRILDEEKKLRTRLGIPSN